MSAARPLAGRIAVVAGATRAAGRGIARMLGEAGATVYCSGRSARGRLVDPARPETIEETAELVTEAGGVGIAVRTDHSVAADVQALFARVEREQGRLDVLVNDIWGGDDLTEWQPFWKLDCERGFKMLDTAVRTHILTSRYGAPMMVRRRAGLIVEVTDGDFHGYRGSLFYDLAKMGTIRLAYGMAIELERVGITALAVTPGFLRSEAMLDRFGVSEANWRDAAGKARGFSESETPCYVGRGVAALASDPNVAARNGTVIASWTLAKAYGFTDVDGRQPDWAAYFDRTVAEILDRGGALSDVDRFWVDARYTQLRCDPSRAAETERMAAALRRPKENRA